MLMKPKVSIITVCYNSAKTIKDCIDSVLSQSYNKIEYIIIDGLSTDSTVSIINSYGEKISKFISEKDEGIYDAMNKGIKMANGDIIGILNSDDLFYNNSIIQEMVSVFQNNDCDAAYGDVIFTKQTNLNKVVRYYSSEGFHIDKFRKGLMPAHPSFFVYRKIYANLGYYDTSYKISADFDLLIRFLLINRLRTVYLPKVIVRMRLGGVSTQGFRSVMKINKENMNILRKHNVQSNYLLLYSRYFKKMLEYFNIPKW